MQLNQKIVHSTSIPLVEEIHKYARWRNLIKGICDTQKSLHQIIVTGSARLDYYRRGGDSLLGRYHYYRLHPFTVTVTVPDQNALRYGQD